MLPAVAPASPMTPKPATTQFTSNAPGAGAQVAGYNTALQNLQNSLKLSGNTTQAGQMQLGQQLQQNQSNIAQSLANRGLGNTTVANTMQQAPLQTYNLGMAQLNDLGALRGMGAFGNLANMQAQGGQAVSQMAQPYAQTDFTQQKIQQMAQPQNPAIPVGTTQMPQGQGGMDPMSFQNLMGLMNKQLPSFQADFTGR